jgi:superfamily I DNA/RNA helicase
MTDEADAVLEPKGEQRTLVDNIQGIYLADAGPGTGKTFTVTKRYVEKLRRGASPDDVLLMTFTESAADEMRDRIMEEAQRGPDVPYGVADLRDAPISTFHSYCNTLLRESGFSAPRHLGIDDEISSSTSVLEDDAVETSEFRDFYHRFIDRHPEYRDLYRIVNRTGNLLDLVKSLAAKGVVPRRNGWFGDTADYLKGDRDAFSEAFEEMNASPDGNQSDLNGKLRNITDSKTFPDPPDVEGLRATSQIDPEPVMEAFDEDREHLLGFVHDLYFEYMEYALDRNYLNFGFLMAFAYVLLHEDDAARDRVSFEYVVVDEFQDTSEIQLKLTMLLAAADNICAVGDWRQSIFSFQYASVNNILEFEDRLAEYRDELNSDGTERVPYPVDDVRTGKPLRNYRSTQEILNFAPNAFDLRGKKSEDVSAEEALGDEPGLEAVDDSEHTEIAAYTSEDEIEMILSRIETMVDSPDYLLESDSEGEDGDVSTRRLTYDDFAVLTRTRDFGVDLYDRASELGVPVSYEGGVKLFNTDEAKLLLAWLRILEDEDSRRGWAVVLENEGYTLDETEWILDEAEYPEDMLRFRDTLLEQPDVASIASRVFGRYGVRDGFTDAIIDQVQSAYDSSYMNLGDLAEYISTKIEEGATSEVDSRLDDDTVNVHTIHSVKGLEYPVVFVANVNDHRFPSMSGGYPSNVTYDEVLGVRQRKVYLDEDDGYPAYDYDNWSYALASKCLPTEYDEERRLMYVAMTRAENYLYFTAETDNESRFFEDLPLEPTTIDASVTPKERETGGRRELEIDIDGREHVKISPSALGHDSESEGGAVSEDSAAGEDGRRGRGNEFGQAVHDFAEDYVVSEDRSSVDPSEHLEGSDSDLGTEDFHNVEAFIDDLGSAEPTEFHVEEKCLLPLEDASHKVLIEGFADLVVVSEDEVLVVDYKTDLVRDAHDDYVKQVSAYHRTLEGVYTDRSVRSGLFYTADDEFVEIDSLSREELLEEALRVLDST